MKALLLLSGCIDRANERVGAALRWLVLATVLISTGNALSRHFFDLSSNAYLEVQWYLYAAFFLGSAGYTLLRNEHVRIDVLLGRFSMRVRAQIDAFGLLFFLLPVSSLLLYLSWPFFTQAWVSKEMSANAGGLILWPVYATLPVGFGLLWLQGWSELIKRVAYLRGQLDAPISAPPQVGSEVPTAHRPAP